MKRMLALLSTFVLLATMASTVAAAPLGAAFPYFIVTRVEHNAYVYLRLYNFPAGETVKVYEDLYGTMAVSGVQVASLTADSTTEFKVEMAAALKDQARGAIRLETADINISGYFINPGGTSTSTTTTTTTTTYSGLVPTFSISSVDVDDTVTISTANFPAHYTFDVLMNTYGTLGIGGTKVASVDSGSGGSLSFTFDIPASLKGASKIAIRMESTTGGFYSYNWFTNKTTSTPSSSTGTGGQYEVVPVFWITAVNADDTVTIKTTDLSPNYTYDVYMNSYGTLGIGGTKVDSVSSGTGGVKTFTVSIPSSLHGASRIAIRLVSQTSGYYGYNWFWNSDY